MQRALEMTGKCNETVVGFDALESGEIGSDDEQPAAVAKGLRGVPAASGKGWQVIRDAASEGSGVLLRLRLLEMYQTGRWVGAPQR